ncbi:hypothetical protein [Candidatus Enterovibrio altilux]|uniref:Uncharacterized protein n=1 Tax=Candidatus Enterovibrio altilux TaxID=1927128 RepID=A0A291B7Z3_9GAMM|nr:hypothetical protein [Candidatus Enterovibrio luxaltus]ATF09128.1 hypothetical protein BTN50_0606 [Candidatus Enterovibrio luxaltus]
MQIIETTFDKDTILFVSEPSITINVLISCLEKNKKQRNIGGKTRN